MDWRNKCIGAKPAGIIGKIAGALMNSIHKNQYQEIIKRIKNASSGNIETILDIGCGGGIALKQFSRIFEGANVIGIDYSQEMVDLSTRINRRSVESGRVKVMNNCVEHMNIDDEKIDIVTVFDNINFWENYEIAFKEIKRVLKNNGLIYIINGYPEVGTKWHDFVKLKNEDEYRNLLISKSIEVETIAIKNNTIMIKGRNLGLIPPPARRPSA